MRRWRRMTMIHLGTTTTQKKRRMREGRSDEVWLNGSFFSTCTYIFLKPRNLCLSLEQFHFWPFFLPRLPVHRLLTLRVYKCQSCLDFCFLSFFFCFDEASKRLTIPAGTEQRSNKRFLRKKGDNFLQPNIMLHWASSMSQKGRHFFRGGSI